MFTFWCLVKTEEPDSRELTYTVKKFLDIDRGMSVLYLPPDKKTKTARELADVD